MLIKLVKHLIFLAPGVVAGLGLSWLIIGILAGSQSIFLHMIISSIIAASLTYIILHRLTKSHIPPLVKIIDTVAIGSAEISHEIDSFQKSASHQG